MYWVETFFFLIWKFPAEICRFRFVPTCSFGLPKDAISLLLFERVAPSGNTWELHSTSSTLDERGQFAISQHPCFLSLSQKGFYADGSMLLILLSAKLASELKSKAYLLKHRTKNYSLKTRNLFRVPVAHSWSSSTDPLFKYQHSSLCDSQHKWAHPYGSARWELWWETCLWPVSWKWPMSLLAWLTVTVLPSTSASGAACCPKSVAGDDNASAVKAVCCDNKNLDAARWWFRWTGPRYLLDPTQ